MTRLLVGLLLVLAPAALSGCSGSESVASAPDSRVPVRVEAVARRDLVHTVTLSGRLRANAVVEVQPKLPGRIVAFQRWEGDRVAPGDLLLELDATELRLELQRAEAAVAQAAARRQEAERRLARSTELFQKDVLSQAKLDGTEAEARMAAADLATAAATRDLVRQRLADARILAPIDGVLQDRRYSVGDFVAPAAAPIFTLIQTDPLLLEVNVSEQDSTRVRGDDAPVPIAVDALPGRSFAGVVEYLAPSLDPVAFTQLIRLRVPNPDGALKPGMFARLEAVREVASAGLVVPADALVDLGDGYGVYVVDGDHTARLRQVDVRFVSGNEAAVTVGLAEGEQVIVEGKSSVREGTAVRLVTRELGAAS